MNIQKKLWKKSFDFKVGDIKLLLLDVLYFFMVLLMLGMIGASFMYVTTTSAVFEQEFTNLMNDPNAPEDLKLEVAESYQSNLELVRWVVVISLLVVMVLFFCFDTLIKTLQYKMILKSKKKYFSLVWKVFKTLAPLYFTVHLLIILLTVIFSFKSVVLLISVVLLLCLYGLMPILRFATFMNKNLKSAYRFFWKSIQRYSIWFSLDIYAFLCIVVIVGFGLLNNMYLTNNLMMNLMSVLQVVLMAFMFLFGRKFIILSNKFIAKHESSKA
jgi:hypothetical protein